MTKQLYDTLQEKENKSEDDKAYLIQMAAKFSSKPKEEIKVKKEK